jgi:ABC-type transporter Mla MlaB component
LPESADLVDLTRLDSVEPAGLRSLIDHQRREQEAGRQLLLRIAPDQVLELTRPEI